MNHFCKSIILDCLIAFLILCFFSCSKNQQPNITGTWHETLQTGQSIHGGQIDSVTYDTIIYTFTSTGRFNTVSNLNSTVYRDSGSYTIQHDTLYLHDQIYGYVNPYYIQSQNANSIVLKSTFIICAQNCDTSIQTDYLYN
jgi:hypothetical protein